MKSCKKGKKNTEKVKHEWQFVRTVLRKEIIDAKSYIGK